MAPLLTARISDYEIIEEDYVTYHIIMKLLCDNFKQYFGKSNTWSINKRFSEFLNLYNTLKVEHSNLIIPCLPRSRDGASSKWNKIISNFVPDVLFSQSPNGIIPGSLLGRRFDVEFVEIRRKYLQLFLNRLLRHPIIATDKILLKFISETPDTVNIEGIHDVSVLDEIKCHLMKGTDIPITIPQSIRFISKGNEQYMRNRSEQMRTNLEKFMQHILDLNSQSICVNKLHKNIAEVMFSWSHTLKNGQFTHIQSAGQWMDTYASIIDDSSQGISYHTVAEMDICHDLADLKNQGRAIASTANRHSQLEAVIKESEDQLKQLKSNLEYLKSSQNLSPFGRFINLISANKDSNQNTSVTFKIDHSKNFNVDVQNEDSLLETEIPSNNPSSFNRCCEKIQFTEKVLNASKANLADFDRSIVREFLYSDHSMKSDLNSTLQSYLEIQLARSKKSLKAWLKVKESLSQVHLQ